MATSPVAVAVAALAVSLVLYLWHVNRGMSSVPVEAAQVAQKPWSIDMLREAYQQAEESPTDVKPFLFAKRDCRYVVCGGSGLVGGWIVQHLLLRGENPAAIRILDLQKPTRPEIAQHGINFIPTDVSDRSAVSSAFEAPWPASVAKWPLTVFHTVAYINPSERKADFMARYEQVNVHGTQNVLDAAQAAGASCFIATSSGSIGVRPINYFLPLWKSAPSHFLQPLYNGNPLESASRLEDFSSCYAYSKYQAEQIVRKADSSKAGFRTGCIRPGHAIYGHGVTNTSSVSYDYLRRGGTPTWLAHIVMNFVNAQNVSIAHLAYENTLLNDPKSPVGGRAYCCTDPNPPIWYGELYRLLNKLAHPMNPVNFPIIPSVPMLLIAHAIEAYTLLRHRYLPFLPRATGDLALLQPAILQMSQAHIIFDDSLARTEIGYKAPISTLEGMCHAVSHYNHQVEAKLAKDVALGKGGDLEPQPPSRAPKAPSLL